jgi:hypothetical protein
VTHKCKNHTHKCKNHTRACGIAASQNPIRIFWWSHVNFSWFVLKSHVSSWKSTRACVNHTRTCRNHTHTCQNHTLREEITLVRIEITRMSGQKTRSVPKSHAWWKSHTCACGIAASQTPIRIFDDLTLILVGSF